MKYNSELEHWIGTIYSPKRSITIDGTLSLEIDGRLKIVGRKYFLTKTYHWIKE